MNVRLIYRIVTSTRGSLREILIFKLFCSAFYSSKHLLGCIPLLVEGNIILAVAQDMNLRITLNLFVVVILISHILSVSKICWFCLHIHIQNLIPPAPLPSFQTIISPQNGAIALPDIPPLSMHPCSVPSPYQSVILLNCHQDPAILLCTTFQWHPSSLSYKLLLTSPILFFCSYPSS